MTAFRSRAHAQFQARIWREYATSKRDYSARIWGNSREQCLARVRAALTWLRANRDSDGNPQGGDGTAPSRSDDSAGPQGIAHTQSGDPA